MILYRALIPVAQHAVLIALIVAASSGAIVFGVYHARIRMEAHSARERVCRAELATMRARNAFVEKFVHPADPCLALEIASR